MERYIIETSHCIRVEIREPEPGQAQEVVKRINAAIPTAKLLTINTVRGVQSAMDDAVSLVYLGGDWDPADIIKAIETDGKLFSPISLTHPCFLFFYGAARSFVSYFACFRRTTGSARRGIPHGEYTAIFLS